MTALRTVRLPPLANVPAQRTRRMNANADAAFCQISTLVSVTVPCGRLRRSPLNFSAHVKYFYRVSHQFQYPSGGQANALWLEGCPSEVDVDLGVQWRCQVSDVGPLGALHKSHVHCGDWLQNHPVMCVCTPNPVQPESFLNEFATISGSSLGIIGRGRLRSPLPWRRHCRHVIVAGERDCRAWRAAASVDAVRTDTCLLPAGNVFVLRRRYIRPLDVYTRPTSDVNTPTHVTALSSSTSTSRGRRRTSSDNRTAASLADAPCCV